MTPDTNMHEMQDFYALLQSEPPVNYQTSDEDIVLDVLLSSYQIRLAEGAAVPKADQALLKAMVRMLEAEKKLTPEERAAFVHPLYTLAEGQIQLNVNGVTERLFAAVPEME